MFDKLTTITIIGYLIIGIAISARFKRFSKPKTEDSDAEDAGEITAQAFCCGLFWPFSVFVKWFIG